MLPLVLTVLAACLLLAAPAAGALAQPRSMYEASVTPDADTDYTKMFAAYTKEYRRTYTAHELHSRYQTFVANIQFIDQWNGGASGGAGAGVTLGVGPHTDWTEAEYAKYRLGYRSSPALAGTSCNTALYEHIVPAKSLDWRSTGAVTGIKDQGQCGACWAFSATGAMEGAWKIAGQSLVSLSEQELLDCTQFDCGGGWMTGAFEWVVQQGGLCSEVDYTFTGTRSPYCQSGMCDMAASISDYSCIEQYNETALAQATNIGPVSVAISAGQPVFQHYSSGIITGSACGTSLDHAVLIVGYATDATTYQDYWIIKNSWSAKWGQQGFAYIAKGTNECGITSDASFPIV